jgi:hypothetical protein
MIQDRFNHGSEVREDGGYGIPHQFVIHGKICMGELVPHTGDLFPGNLRVFPGKGFRQQFHCFSDDKEIVGNGVSGLFISSEGFVTHPFREGIYPVDGKENIF